MHEPRDNERRQHERPERSGDFSADERFDPDEQFDVLASSSNADQVGAAIRAFLARGNPDELRQAIAIYTRSARAHGKSVENVLAELNSLIDQRHGRYKEAGKLLEPSELKQLVLTTVFAGFGG